MYIINVCVAAKAVISDSKYKGQIIDFSNLKQVQSLSKTIKRALRPDSHENQSTITTHIQTSNKYFYLNPFRNTDINVLEDENECGI